MIANHDENWKSCFYFIEATDFEKSYLYEKYEKKVCWEHNSFGHVTQIGVLDNRPVMLAYHINKINGMNVCFWHITSQVADYYITDKWLEKYAKPYHSTDAQNFRNCLYDIESYLNSKKAFNLL